jgi:predicted nucleic acid-binding protein
MPANPRRIYFDANVFLAYISSEEGRAGTVQSVIEEARRGEIEIITSILSIAEVAFAAHEKAKDSRAMAKLRSTSSGNRRRQ